MHPCKKEYLPIRKVQMPPTLLGEWGRGSGPNRGKGEPRLDLFQLQSWHVL